MRLGAALPAVLMATAVTSALVVGGSYVARQQMASSRLASRAALIQPAAEEALINAIVNWDTMTMSQQPVGSALRLSSPQPTSTALTDVWVTRASPAVYWLTAESQGVVPPALKRRVGVLVRLTNGYPRPVSHRAWADLP
jgi:hypothetical protein